MTIAEKVAYLKGLAEGLNIDTEKSKEGKLIHVMIGILEEIGLSIEDLEENSLALGEEIDVLSDDLADVEDVVFGDDEDEDEDEDIDLEEDFEEDYDINVIRQAILADIVRDFVVDNANVTISE